MPRTRGLQRLPSRWTASDAAALLADWRRSGVALPVYCRRRRIEYERLRRWRSKLESRSDAEAIKLEPVCVVEASATAVRAAGLELELTDGRRVRLGADFEAEALTRLLRVLDSAPCS